MLRGTGRRPCRTESDSRRRVVAEGREGGINRCRAEEAARALTLATRRPAGVRRAVTAVSTSLFEDVIAGRYESGNVFHKIRRRSRIQSVATQTRDRWQRQDLVSKLLEGKAERQQHGLGSLPVDDDNKHDDEDRKLDKPNITSTSKKSGSKLHGR